MNANTLKPSSIQAPGTGCPWGYPSKVSTLASSKVRVVYQEARQIGPYGILYCSRVMSKVRDLVGLGLREVWRPTLLCSLSTLISTVY
jgi:hypothetical protein